LQKVYSLGAVDSVDLSIIPQVVAGKVTTQISIYRRTKELERARAELEDRIQERTAALESANRQLRTDEEKLERVVAKRTQQLNELVHEQEAFAYTLSHELRAPLRSVQGMASIVKQDYGEKLDEKGRRCLDRIDAATARMTDLIRDVLAYSQVLVSSTELVPVDLDRLVQQAIEHNSALQSLDSKIHIERPLPSVRGHEVFLSQVVTNLLSNAVKFVAPGTIPHVRIWSESVDGRVRLWIQDNGIGIPEQLQHRTFNLFERLHSELKYEGTGVGLAIVKKAVERMQGKGTQFWVELSGIELPDDACERSENPSTTWKSSSRR
jgi:signal transduction histidine kinase